MADNLIECERCNGDGEHGNGGGRVIGCAMCGGSGKVQAPPTPLDRSGGPAFPRGAFQELHGMTLRQWYKGQALVSLAGRNFTLDERVIIASDLADAMIQEDADHDS